MFPPKRQQRFIKIVPLIVVFFTLATVVFLYQHTRQQRLEEEQLLLRQQQEQFAQLQKERLEQERQEHLVWIKNQRTVHEPVLSATQEQWHSILKTHDIAFPTPLPPWSEYDQQLLQSILGETIRADLLTTDEKLIDFKQMTTQLRVFKKLYQYLDERMAEQQEDQIQTTHKVAWDLYTALERQLYPWIQHKWQHVFDINKSSSSTDRGIVMCVGNDQFHFAMRTIHAIRQLLKCSLPIQIFAINDNDLSELKRSTLMDTFDGVSVHNIVDSIDTEGTEFGGWSLKPFAALASRFQQVILMDADVYFFQSPDTLFDDAGFLATGSLFFYDRTLFPRWTLGRHWMESFLPSMSSLVRHSRWWKYSSAHEQESGVVVIDKKKSLLGLLGTCKMNAKRERDEVSYRHVHGDKETFWLGYEIMQTPYAFVKTHGGVLGGLGDGGDPTRVCGNILHLDAQQQPYWWNGGLLRNKNKWPDRYLLFTHFAQGEDWDFETSCIKETDQIHEFSEQDKETAQQLIKADKEFTKYDDLQ